MKIEVREVNRPETPGRYKLTAWVEDQISGDQEFAGSLTYGNSVRGRTYSNFDWFLYDLVVELEYRQRGVATELMNRFWELHRGEKVAVFDFTRDGHAFWMSYSKRTGIQLANQDWWLPGDEWYDNYQWREWDPARE